MAHNALQTTLRVGGKVPLFYLPSAGGGQSGPAATRSKYNLVLAFLPNGPEAAAYVRGIARRYPDILRNDARVLAVLDADLDTARRTAEVLELPFTLLSDENGAAATRVLGGGNPAGLVAADRYGIVYFVETAHTLEGLPPPATILDWLEFIEIQCPECTDANASPWFEDRDYGFRY